MWLILSWTGSGVGGTQESDSAFESSNIQTTLQRWEEASAALDGPATHLVMAVFKEQLLEHLVPIYEQETKPKETAAQRTQGSSGVARDSGPNQLSVPHSSDQATPSPRGESSVDQLRSSLRQVANALAETVAAVRNTQERLQETSAAVSDSSQEVNNMEDDEEEDEREGEEADDIHFAEDPDPNLLLPYPRLLPPPPLPPRGPLPPLPPLPLPTDQFTPTSSSSSFHNPLLSASSQASNALSEPSGVALSSPLEQTATSTITTSSSSLSPQPSQSSGRTVTTTASPSRLLPTLVPISNVSAPGLSGASASAVSSFDGSQESARATLEQTDPQDPLYTFLSAYVGAPPPVSSIETPTTTATDTTGFTHSESLAQSSSTPSSQPPPTSLSSPRLPVFTQMQSSSAESTQYQNPARTQGQPTLPALQPLDPIPSSLTNVHNQSYSATRAGTATSAPSSARQLQPQTSSATPANQANSIASIAESIASQVTSFFQSNPFDQPQSARNLDESTTLATSLAREISRTTSQLMSTSSGARTSQLTPTTTSTTTSASSNSLTISSTAGAVAGQSSPSPSDTLAPLISSLQMPTHRELLRRLEESRTTGPSDNTRIEDEVEPPTSHTGENVVDTESASMLSGTLWQQVGEVLPQDNSGDSEGRSLLEPALSQDISPTRAAGGEDGGEDLVSQENQMDEERTTVGGSTSDATATSSSTASAAASAAASANIPPNLQQLPDTIDHEVLAALPETIQQEILAQHEREQRARQAQREGFATAISPEFLSALPPNIQEELLQQERAEQARQRQQQQQQQQQQSSDAGGGATAPSAPADNLSFFHNLTPELRRTILADVDDSVISHLPDEIASEARALRQERETRRRQILEQRHAVLERIFEQASAEHGPASAYLPSTWDPSSYRYAILNLNPHQVLDGHHHHVHHYPHHHHHLARLYQNMNSMQGGMQQGGSRAGQTSKQMLDQEALTCLLILLFFDQNKLHNNRLHRIVKNLSQHTSTRAWIISSLLTILHKASPSMQPSSGTSVSHTCPLPPPLTSQQQSSGHGDQQAAASSSAHLCTPVHHYTTPHWLNLTTNAALGSHTHVFQFHQSGKVGSNPNIHIHSLASSQVCNNVLDLLVFLSRQFPSSFLPSELMPNDKTPGGNGMGAATGSSGSGSKQVCNRVVSNFWQILLRLDGAANRKGKGLLKGFQFQEPSASCSAKEIFSQSIIGQLMKLLQDNVVRESVSLTDKLLRVLSVASGPIPKTGLCRRPTEVTTGASTAGPSRAVDATKPGSSTQSTLLVPAGAESQGGASRTVTQSASSDDVFVVEEEVVEPFLLHTVISVLTSGLCSEDGLDDATLLLTNLSKCSVNTRENILVMLLDGIRTIGLVLSSQIMLVIDDLYAYWKTNKKGSDDSQSGALLEPPNPASNSAKSSSSAAATLSSEPTSQSSNNVIPGVVLPSVSPDSLVDHSKDLHLPSMIPLTCKGSQQSFFLRMLKVVCQLRESAKSVLQGPQKTASEFSRVVRVLCVSSLTAWSVLWAICVHAS